MKDVTESIMSFSCFSRFQPERPCRRGCLAYSMVRWRKPIHVMRANKLVYELGPIALPLPMAAGLPPAGIK